MFKYFISYIILISAILPVIYIYLVQYGYDKGHYFYNHAAESSFVSGNIYTLASCFIFYYIAKKYKPKKLSADKYNRHISIYKKNHKLIFILGFISLLISIYLSYRYGRSAVNLTASRPFYAVYAGYLTRILYFASELYIIYQILLFGKLSKKGWIMLCLILLNLSMSWSRSGLMAIAFIYLISCAYSFKDIKIELKYLISILIMGSCGVLFGQYLRSGDGSDIMSEIFLRFYANNSVLYIGITDHTGIYNILMEGQPRIVLQQIFSFLFERTEYPSSLRLAEYFGGTVSAGQRGHIVGYAFGWLGLTYGLFKWFGLVLVYFIFLLIFKGLKYGVESSSFAGMVIYVYSSRMLLEFLGNLGLDSFVEKSFKWGLSGFIFILIVTLANKNKYNIKLS